MPGKVTKAKSRYRPEIDGLRAFAVIAVIINHFNKVLLPSGYLGVDIFFVISGYVITSSLADRQSKNFWDFLGGFYERRIKRLVPALVVFVLVTSVLISFFDPDVDSSLRAGMSSLFGLSNLYLLKQSTDYFAESTELNPFTHTWSLGVEEQFYLLFPFLIWFSGFGRQAAKGARNLFFWIGALSIASLGSFIYLYHVNQPAAYFLMPARFWEMSAGCLIFVGFQKREKIEQALEQVPPLLVVAAMVGVMFLPVSAAVPATIGIVLLSAVLIACLKQGTAAFTFFTLEKVVYIGLISYSLYLWHWSVLTISRWTIAIHWWSVPIQGGLMLLLAVGSHRWIEMPFRKMLWARKKVISLAKGFAATGLTLVSVFGLAFFRDRFSRIGGILLGSKNFEEVGILQESIYCHLPRKSDSAISDCLKSASSQNRSVYIVGDSHASNHFPSVKTAFQQIDSGTHVSVLIDWGFINWLRGIDDCGSYDPCIKNSGEQHLNFFRDHLRQGDIVIFSWFRDRVISGDVNRLPRKSDSKKLEILEDRLNSIIPIVVNAGARIVLVDDIPRTCAPGVNFKHEVVRMRRTEKCSVSEDVSLNDRSGMTRLYVNLSSRMPESVLYFDPHPSLCSDGICDLYDRRYLAGNRILFGDSIGHFRPDYPNPLAGDWKKYFIEILAL